MRRLLAAVAAVAASVVLLTGCQAGLSDTGEPLTVAQSELLAQTRFQVASRGDVVLDVSLLPDDEVDHVALTVTLDPVDHLAWGTMSRGPAGLAVEEPVVLSPDGVFTQQAGTWQPSTADAAVSSAVAVAFALGSDRPENAQLLRQSDARYLGAVDVDGAPQQVFRVPSADGEGAAVTRLWLDADGRLRRLDAGDDDRLVILLTDATPQPRPEGIGADG
ncbi:MAG: hypothetical protein J7484_12670 [Microbacterium sp.]|nr:hypothetical protein [Microbacterium sp.]